MKQKLAVARALLHRPGLLFLDEPTAGLDPVAAATLRDELGTLVRREGVTVFLTTHNLVEAERLCGRVAVIKQGRLLAVGHPDELKARSATRAEIAGRGFGERMLSMLRDWPGVRAREPAERAHRAGTGRGGRHGAAGGARRPERRARGGGPEGQGRRSRTSS